jgi:dUTP pyrophosphatase
MGKTFLLKLEDEIDESLYSNHSTYHAGDSGLDLFVLKDQDIGPGETVLLDLGIIVQCRSKQKNVVKLCKGEMYNYHSYLMLPRSSVAKTPLIMRNSLGLIDKGYIGSLKAAFYNTSNEVFKVKRGERYVQLVNYDLSEVKFKIVNKVRETSRGIGGFGSTGK